jgi:hypothetical protein
MPPHPTVTFTIDDILANKHKFKIPDVQLEKLEARGIKRETLV